MASTAAPHRPAANMGAFPEGRVHDAREGENCGGIGACPGACPPNGRPAEAGQQRRRLLFYHPDDHNHLTELICLVRKQIEVFVEPHKNDKRAGEDRDGAECAPAPTNGDDSTLYAEGKVGIRCVHCAPPPPPDEDPSEGRRRGRKNPRAPSRRVRGAVVYPTSTRLVYQSVRNWQRHHMLSCPAMPSGIREEFASLKSATWQRRSSNDSSAYWAKSCARVGMVDTPNGLRLRKAALDGSWTEEMAMEEMAQASSTAKVGTAKRKSRGEPDLETSTSAMEVDPVGVKLDLDAAKTMTSHAADLTTASAREATASLSNQPSSNSETNTSDRIKTEPFLSIGTRPNCHQTSQHCEASSSSGTPLASSVGQHVSPELKSFAAAATLALHSGGATKVDASESSVVSQGEIRHIQPTWGRVHQLGGAVASLVPQSSMTPAPKTAKAGEIPSSTAQISSQSLAAGSIRRPSPNVDPSQRKSSANGSDVSVQTSNTRGRPASTTGHRNEDLLERVRLARGVVHGLLELPTASPEPGGVPGASAETPREDGLAGLGRKLYELFAGGPPSGLDAAEADGSVTSEGGSASLGDCEELSQQRQKRDKRLEVRKYVPLRELGLPTSLCSLVSGLLRIGDHGAALYRSFDEVDEDLRLMEQQPEKFLCSQSTGEFKLPHDMIYGRKEEVSTLLKAFDWATNPRDGISTMVLISGHSGAGKSSLVRCAQSHFVERGACFVSGKFDAMRQTQPLSAMLSALDDYCALFAQDKDRVVQVKNAFVAAAGGEIGVLTNLIPSLRKAMNVSGEFSSAQVGGREVMQRLLFLLRTLLRVSCSNSNPLVLFLDDLQWADEVSLKLMRVLITDSQIRGLLFIGCYRDSEVASNHPLLAHLRSIQSLGSISATTIHVGNLDKGSVNAFLSDTLRMLPRMTEDLSETIVHKTGGRALFVVQFLVSLRDEGLLRFSLPKRQWEWDIDIIRAKDIADNVVELMTTKMLRLSTEVCDALRVVGGLGAEIHEDVLQIIDRVPPVTVSTVAALDKAVSEGLVMKAKSAYRFSHDQIQNAAYSLIPESEREAFHLKMGRRLWRNASMEEMQEHLFVVVNQMHRGARLITDESEKINLVELTLAAGQKASAMSAFAPASDYLRAGISLIAVDDWEHHRELCLDVYNLCLEMECILGNFSRMKIYSEEVLRRGRTLRERLCAYYALVQSKGSEANTSDAFAIATPVLGQLGESFPSTVTQKAIQEELIQTQAILLTKSEDELLRLRAMEDVNKSEAMRFFKLLLTYAYAGRQGHFTIVACRMVQLSVQYGVCRESAVAFGCYGMVLCGLVGDTAGGYRFGKLACALFEKFHAKESQAQLSAVVYGFINNWVEPIQASLPPLKEAIDVGLSTGDTENAMVNAHLYLGLSFSSGKPLGPLMNEMKLYSKQMAELNQNLVCLLNKPVRQATLNLLGKSADAMKLVGEEMDEATLLMNTERDSYTSLSSMVYFYETWLAYLFGEYELAAETAKKNQDVEKHRMSRFDIVCNHAFYSGLSALAMARKEGRSKWVGTIDKTMAQMKSWASSSSWNCQHKLELMIAEYAYLEGDISEAAKAYDCAVSTAKRHNFIHEQALALERAGIFYSENGSLATASALFDKAFNCYTQWEAYSKAAHVKKHYLKS